MNAKAIQNIVIVGLIGTANQMIPKLLRLLLALSLAWVLALLGGVAPPSMAAHAFENDGEGSEVDSDTHEQQCASEEGEHPCNSCSVTVQNPKTWDPNKIEVEGLIICSGLWWEPSKIVLTIQKYKGLGIWNNLQKWSKESTDNWNRKWDLYDCTGKGEQTYRLIADGYKNGDKYVGTDVSDGTLRRGC